MAPFRTPNPKEVGSTILLFKNFSKTNLKRISDIHVVAATLYNRQRKPYRSNIEQWRRVIAVRYPDDYTFPVKDIAIVVSIKLS